MSKAAERQELHDLDEVIERALAETKERVRLRQLAASPKARSRIAAESAKSWLDRGEVPIGKHRAEQRFARAELLKDVISVHAAKERVRLARKNADSGPIGPTPEREAKASDGMVVGTVVKSHQTKTLLNQYGRVLPQELVSAGTQLICDWLAAEAGPRVVGGYDGVPSSGGGARAGGVQDYIREVQATVTLQKAEFHPEFIRIIEWFLTCTVLRADGSTMKLEDAGRRISPWTPEEKHQGIGFGQFYMTLALAARFYGRQRALGRQRTPPSPDEIKRLLNEGAARLQNRREQYGRHLEEEEKKSRMAKGGGR